jgi:hypothetical protein
MRAGLLNNDLEKLWKEAAVAQFNIPPPQFLVGTFLTFDAKLRETWS